MTWFVLYTEKGSGRIQLVGPFASVEHAETFMLGLVYQSSRYEGPQILSPVLP